MANVIIPVGFSRGPYYPMVDPPRATPDEVHVSLGHDDTEMSLHEARVWAASGFDAERHAKLENTRESLIDLLKTNEPDLPDPAALVAGLVNRGLLLEFDPLSNKLEPVFRKYSIHPLGQGLGNRQDAPHLFQIGMLSKPILEVDAMVYGLWSLSFGNVSLWDACEEFAEAEDDPDEPPLDISAEQVAREFAVNVPLLISTGCAFLTPSSE